MNISTSVLGPAIKLQMMRLLLCLPVNEAASMYFNMSEKQWHDFEAGRAPIPAQVIDKLESLYAWRCGQLVIMRQLFIERPEATMFEFWPRTMDDWMAIEGNEPEHFRPCQSLYTALASEYPKHFRLLPFDLQAFTQWVAGRRATLELQSQYLALLTEPQRNDLPQS